MTDTIIAIDAPWLWLIGGVLLGIAEMVVPGVYLMWIGGAAVLTGVVALLLPVGVAAQFAIFAVATIAAIYVGRRFLMANPIASADPMLNEKGKRLVGTIVVAVEPVDAFQGRVKVGDGVWSARGADAVVGDRLRVTGCEGAMLVVERA
jgi:inner membrane protein